jgi:hypothetical protein
VCPFLRLEEDGALLAPRHAAHPDNRCAAIGEPQPQSTRQQELVCLQPAHGTCPRYLRGALAAPVPVERGPVVARVPRATLAAVLVLVLAAGASFGFVLQRGGIHIVPARTPSPGATTAVGPTASTAPTVASTSAPTPSVTPAPTAEPTAAPTIGPTVPPTASPAPATPGPATPAPSPTPGATSDRYALLEPCPDAPDCWIYTVRAGDNFTSIANYFGHPVATLQAWNPQVTDPALLRAGDRLRMPPPTR